MRGLSTFLVSSILGLTSLGTAHAPPSYNHHGPPDHSSPTHHGPCHGGPPAHHEDKSWHTWNHPAIHHLANGAFSITTPSDTDIWRPNVTADNFTAPYVYRKCNSANFKSVSVTISAPWKTLYDQGGLAVAFPTHDGKPLKWIKSGIEFTEGAPALGTVATDRFSDWSLSPMVPVGAQSARFTAERTTTEMWVYKINKGGKRQQLREVTWAFLDGRGEAEMWVGVYAAKPTEEKNPKEGLTVTFSDLVIDC